MSNIIDLNILVNENLKFLIGESTYEIPNHLDTETFLMMVNYEKKANTAKKLEEEMKLMDEMVFELFSKLNDVTFEWVKGLNITQKKAILEHYKNKLSSYSKDPN